MKKIPLIIALLLGVSPFTGCISSKYQQAPKGTPPPVALGLASTPDAGSPASGSPLRTVVQNVIVHQGPGSWKRAAYWDEYVVSITNRGTATLVVDAAKLTDFQGTPTSPGTDPWALEKESRSYASRARATTGDALKIGGGAAATTGMTFAFGALKTGIGIGSGWNFASATLLITSMGIALPAYAVGVSSANFHSRHRIEDQFRFRRLVLPLTIVPGQVVQGSLFFRITAGPRRLVLHSRAGNAHHNAVINLTSLADLHINRKPGSPAADPSKK